MLVSRHLRGSWIIPNNQNATKTERSAPWNRPANRALYAAHDEPGLPGNGNRPEEDGERLMVVVDDCARNMGMSKLVGRRLSHVPAHAASLSE